MSEKEKQIIETFMEVIPKMSEQERNNLLNFGRGMAFMKDKQEKKTTRKNKVKF